MLLLPPPPACVISDVITLCRGQLAALWAPRHKRLISAAFLWGNLAGNETLPHTWRKTAGVTVQWRP